ncbi:unnamed protein product, partial [marine sediment metagenome]
MLNPVNFHNHLMKLHHLSQATTHSHMSIYGLTYEDQLRVGETFSHVERV